MTSIRFFVPATGDRISGGHAYDRRMLAALRDLGHDAVAVPVEDDAQSAWHALAADAVVLIDAQTLAPFLPLVDALKARGAAILVHHPTAMEPGLSAAAHATLRAAEHALLANVGRIIVASDVVAARLNEAFAVPYTQIAIVPPGVDGAARSPGSDGGICEILSIGALVPRKGHDVLLRALARLRDLSWGLTIVGTPMRHPEHAKALCALADELEIADRVRFVGAVDDAALEGLWRRSDLLALATQWEATPGPTADALRRGLPVVVCDGGAAAALMTPLVGGVVPTGDAEAFSKVLRRIIFDAALRAELADAAWQIGATLPIWRTQASLLLQAIL